MNPQDLKNLIESDAKSLEKQKMNEGYRYYRGNNDILKHDFRAFYVNDAKYIDYNKSNVTIPNNYLKLLVDQKSGYISGKEVTIKTDTQKFTDRINEVIGSKFSDIISELIKTASNKGYEGLVSYIDEDGNFDFTNVDGRGLIFIKDTDFQKKVVKVIRYYEITTVDDKGTEKPEIRAEVWDSEKVTYYQSEDGIYYQIPEQTGGIMDNPQYHYYIGDDDERSGGSWGKIPLLQYENNTEDTTDLEPIKQYVDAMDLVVSGAINDLKDIQLAIWVLRGYEGEDLAEFMMNLQKFKAIKLSADGNSNAEPKTLEIPHETRSKLMLWLDKMIFKVGQGVDVSDITGGSITNVVINAMYTGLDIKSNKAISKLKVTLKQFMWFVTEYINMIDGTNYDYKNIKITFNKSMVFNEKEVTDMILSASGKISDETIVGLLPFIDDPETEWQKVKKQRQSELDTLTASYERSTI